jgi:flagellar protein FliJ
MQRRENLKRSAVDLKSQLDDAKSALAEAFEEMKKVETLDERDQMHERCGDEAEAQLMRSA